MRYSESVRYFCRSGPVEPGRHYSIPPLDRIDLDEILARVDRMEYFVLHAPRQTGKTSILLALADLLNRSGKYRCVYASLEGARAMRDDIAEAMPTLLEELGSCAEEFLQDEFVDSVAWSLLERFGPRAALRRTLVEWAKRSSKPLVLLFDEFDTLGGDALLSVLGQLRSGYRRRPHRFPQTVVLCGLRDVRDYKVRISKGGYEPAGSAFNIVAESLRLSDFTEREVRCLLGQHVTETGQEFTEEALADIWKQTLGQPWLVNALAFECCFRDEAGRDRGRPVSLASVQRARERLILRRDTHLDQLLEKLKQPRLRRVIEPVLSGRLVPPVEDGDIEYARDMGLVARQDPLAIANPIYHEIIPRALTSHVQSSITHKTARFVGKDGRLLVGKLLKAFQDFFREDSEHWLGCFDYLEAGPQLLLQAFLQRIVSSGGRVNREYGLGRMRTDLLVVWPAASEGSEAPGQQKAVIEGKLRHGSLEATVGEGLVQTGAYMDRADAEEGHLVIFDRSAGKTWKQKIFCRKEEADGRQITVWGM